MLNRILETPIVLIPCRMESVRFPAKPLALINGTPMVVWCARNAEGSDYLTYICTDSEIIIDAARQFGHKTIKTPSFNTGTDRVNWAANQLGAQRIINLQGDEPLINSEAIRHIGKLLLENDQHDGTILNGLVPLENQNAFNPNNIKAVINLAGSIVYLSRKAIRNNRNEGESSSFYLKQLGLYAFNINELSIFAAMPQSPLELAEKIEMLRWIDNSFSLKGICLDTLSLSVDTPEDLVEVEEILLNI